MTDRLRVESHIVRETADFDPVTGELHAATGDAPVRGRFWRVAGRLVVLYRTGTVLRLRIDEVDVPLGHETRLAAGSGHVTLAHREAKLEFAYPSMRDPVADYEDWESEEDRDLLLFAQHVNDDPRRRKTLFATEAEKQLGELVDDDLRTGTRAALATAFDKRRVIDCMRELERWLWRWKPADASCALCGRSSIAEVQFLARRLSDHRDRFRRFEAAQSGQGPLLCVRCIRLGRQVRDIEHTDGRAPEARAHAVLRDIERALAASALERREAIAAALRERADAVARTPPRDCVTCGQPDAAAPQLRFRDAAICRGCIALAMLAWRTDCSREPSLARPVFVWLAADGVVLCRLARQQLRVWIDAIPGRPVEVFPWELAEWDPPFEGAAIDEADRERLRDGLTATITEQFGAAPVFRVSGRIP